MSVPRILLSHRLRSRCKTCNPLSPIFLQSSSYKLSSNLSTFLLQKGISVVAGDSKPEKPKSLSSLFANSSSDSQSKRIPPFPEHAKADNGKRKEYKQPSSSIYRRPEEGMKKFPEKISKEASALLVRFYEEGYLKVEPDQVPTNVSSRRLMKGAAERLGQQHQKISKWLSGSDLKKVALFGCPSIERKTTLAAKRLRSFFCIQEDIICRGCKLKSSCKFVNQKVEKVDKVILADVMRLITMLAFDDIPQQLSVPDDVKLSVDKLLTEVVNLSE